ncbi:MAG: NHL repeat-containing protein [Planctomycetales bacterium]|nr:NHL repeat-containing protein [Planctomycetales bacterium]
MHLLKEYSGTLVTGFVAIAVGLASYVVVRSDPFAERSNAVFTMDFSALYDVEPELIQYEQTSEISANLKGLRSLAVGPDDKIYCAGSDTIAVYSSAGKELYTIRMEAPPNCLAVGGSQHLSPGRLYVAVGNKVQVIDADGSSVANWTVPGDDVILASIVVAEKDVFVADAGNRVVLRFDEQGNVIGKIGAEGSQKEFNVPNTYFDLAIGSDGLLQVVNPGMLRTEIYTYEGQMEVRWGEPGTKIENFFGCCNPSHIAVLPSGQVVTSEKGVPRVKLYSPYGEFECVIASPKMLGVAESELGDPRDVQAKAVFDVAADSQGRVLVLDPRRNIVRVYTPKQETTAQPAA